MSIFMHYEGIEGESSDKGHGSWIDVENIHWGVRRNITSQTSTQNDRESANAQINDLVIQRRMDAATPRIFIESCCGKGKTVTIRLSKTGNGNGSDVYMEYVLHNALISHYLVDAIAQLSARPMETITISFVDLEVKYTPFDEDGAALSPIVVGFNTATNEKH